MCFGFAGYLFWVGDIVFYCFWVGLVGVMVCLDLVSICADCLGRRDCVAAGVWGLQIVVVCWWFGRLFCCGLLWYSLRFLSFPCWFWLLLIVARYISVSLVWGFVLTDLFGVWV